MKMLYILNNFPKISETFVINQIAGLIDNGIDIKILARNNPNEITVHNIFYDYKLEGKVHYLITNESRLGFELNDLNIESLIDSDIVHAHFATWAADIAHNISKILNIPYVVTVHARDLYMNTEIDKLKRNLNDANKIITISEYNKKYIQRMLGEISEDKISVIRCGIKTNEFKRDINWHKGESRLRILSVGRLIEKKGIHLAVQAFVKICRKYENVEYVIIGDGPKKDEILNIISDNGMEDRISFCGVKSQIDVINEMRKADIYILPSIIASDGDREGLPVSILEAQAMQIPVISTRHTGIPEAVIDGVTGFLLTENDIEAIAEKMEVLISDERLRKKMGQQGRRIVEQYFKQEDEIKNLIKIINEIKRFDVSTLTERDKFLLLFKEGINQKDYLLEKLEKKTGTLERNLKEKDHKINELEAYTEKIKKTVFYKLYRRFVGTIKNLN